MSALAAIFSSPFSNVWTCIQVQTKVLTVSIQQELTDSCAPQRPGCKEKGVRGSAHNSQNMSLSTVTSRTDPLLLSVQTPGPDDTLHISRLGLVMIMHNIQVKVTFCGDAHDCHAGWQQRTGHTCQSLTSLSSGLA